MTIIAAYDDGKKYWIASDSVGSDGTMKYELGSKLIKKGNYIIGFSWSYRVADIIKECNELPEKLLGMKDLRKIRDIVKTVVSKDLIVDSFSEDNNAGRHSKAAGHPMDLIIISPSGIYTLEGDYQIHRVPDGYISCGSGGDIGMGVLYGCRQLKVEGKEAVNLAIKAAIKHIPGCGGKCYIKSVEKK